MSKPRLFATDRLSHIKMELEEYQPVTLNHAGGVSCRHLYKLFATALACVVCDTNTFAE